MQTILIASRNFTDAEHIDQGFSLSASATQTPTGYVAMSRQARLVMIFNRKRNFVT